MPRNRKKPLTVIGIGRVRCDVVGCSNKGYDHWQICADKRLFRVVCAECDIKINEMVMRFVFGDAKEKELDEYREFVRSWK